MSDETNNSLDSVVDELRAGLEDGSIILDRRDDKRPPRDLPALRVEAERFINANLPSTISALLSAGLIPGITTMALNQAEISMVYNLARIYGSHPSMDEAKEIAAKLNGQIIASIAAAEVSTFIPVIGWAIKPAIVASAAKAFGKVAVNYFEQKAKESLASNIDSIGGNI